MDFKHLQLNTSTLRSPEKIMEFIENRKWGANGIDVGCFQEICYPIGEQNPLQKLLEGKGCYYAEGIHYHYLPKKITIAVGIFSRWPIIDYTKLYYNTETYHPKEITGEEFMNHNLIGETRVAQFPGSRALANSVKPRCILSVLVDSPSGPLRVVTTHFTVTDLCTETHQMYEMSRILNSYIGTAKPLPTIFSADLNIRPQSYSVGKISEVMTCHTKDLENTLSDDHIAITGGDFPGGLAVDHVFSSNVEYLKTDLVQVDFSVHKALVSEFAL